MIIRNWHELTSKGNVQGREIVLEVMEYALEQVNSYNLLKEQINLGNALRIGPFNYDLRKFKNIFIVGGGKQTRGITAGCSVTPRLYCPASPVTRGQMAVFLSRAFGL